MLFGEFRRSGAPCLVRKDLFSERGGIDRGAIAKVQADLLQFLQGLPDNGLCRVTTLARCVDRSHVDLLP
ncbi:MAG: hypothetical protein ACO4CZ_18120, partial [Planctomycetota bacterium]